MKEPYLTVIIPVYNEAETLETVIETVQQTGFEKQIIVVDDASTDGSREKIKSLRAANIQTVFHERNRGKGAAIRSAQPFVRGSVVLIQDADQEYHPEDYEKLIRPIERGYADAVFGSRFIGPHRCFLFYHYLGNQAVNFLANVLYNTTLSDLMTCYKVFKRKVFCDLDLRADRFGFEAEITGEMFLRKQRVYEVPVFYSGRNYSQGKKIRWTDFFDVVYWLVKTRFKTVKHNA